MTDADGGPSAGRELMQKEIRWELTYPAAVGINASSGGTLEAIFCLVAIARIAAADRLSDSYASADIGAA